MTDLECLLVEKACQDIVLAAADAVDQQDYQTLAALFANDGELVRPGGSPLRGPQAIRASYAVKDPERLTRHVVSNIRVSVHSPTAAHARCVVTLWSTRRSEPLTPQGRKAHPMQQLGEIEDEFVRTADGWKIQRRIARFTYYHVGS